MALTGFLTCVPLAVAPTPGELSRDQMRADLEQLARDVRASWSYLEDREQHSGVELEAWIAAAIASLPESASPDEFAAVLRPIVAGLSDGHAALEVPGAGPGPTRVWPVTLREVREGVAVARVADGVEVLDGSRAPRVGELVLGAGGVAISDLWQRAQEVTFASTPGMRRAAALERLCRTDAPQVALEVRGAAGGARVVHLATVEPAAPGLRSDVEPPWSVEELRPGVAYLRIASFRMPDWDAWLAADQRARDAMQVDVKRAISELFARLALSPPRALVLDVRGNDGGTDSLGIHFAERLLPGSFQYFQLSAKSEGEWTAPHGYTYGTEEDLSRYEGPLVALIDEGCFSTTDNFLRALVANHPDLTTVGRPTGAGTGAPRVVSRLEHSGASVTLCTMRVFDPDGLLIEGRGTHPDLPVEWSREDLAAGRDPDLDAALELLAERGLIGG